MYPPLLPRRPTPPPRPNPVHDAARRARVEAAALKTISSQWQPQSRGRGPRAAGGEEGEG